MKSAVVLGAAGFVGRYVAKAFNRAGYRVVGIGHGHWQREEWERWGLSEWHVASISSDALMTYAGKPEVLVQCAGSGSVSFSMDHPEQDFKRSVQSTLSALEFVRVHVPACRFVLPSSAAVYGNVDRLPISVSDPLNPQSPYGAHKIMAEDLCRSYATFFGVRAAIVRLFSVYGVGLRKQLLWDACTKLTSGQIQFSGTGQELRDWLHVEDAASLIIRAADNASPSCAVVNGGVGECISVRSVLEKLKAALGIDEELEFSGEMRSGDPKGYKADATEALDWGWLPKRGFDEGLAEYASWFRKS